MKTLGNLLGSAGRTEVLRVLNYQPGLVGLRQVARRAGVHARSAELALDALVGETLVNCKRTATRALYEMNRDHPDARVLEALFEAAARAAIGQRSSSLHARARGILPFIAEATRMLANAKGSRHVT
jgi:hypothetical protein